MESAAWVSTQGLIPGRLTMSWSIGATLPLVTRMFLLGQQEREKSRHFLRLA
jgi:hypothetical protein